MKRQNYTIADIKGYEGQARLDHYNKWLLDPKRVPGTLYPGYPADKKALSRKKGKMIMEAVATETVVVTKPSKAPKADKAPKVTKLSIAAGVVKATGKDDKEACLKAIVESLNVTRGNASIYYAKALALLG
jgi:hypothetical protein